MLTDAELLLITAAVDGELSQADLRAYDSLVVANPSAAALAGHLRSTADRLHRLPKRPAPAEVLPAVLARLPLATAPARRAPRQPVWVPLAVAASLLFAVSAGSFWFFAGRPPGESTAKSRPTGPVAPTPPIPRHPQDPVLPDPGVVVAGSPDLLPLPREVMVAAVPPTRDVAPMPRSHGGEFVGAGISERSKPIQAVELRLPFAGDISDFAREEVRARFAADFAGDPALRIDLSARNLPVAADLLAAAARKAGVVVAVDAATQDRLAKKVPVAYALFVEGLTPLELANLLAEAARQAAAVPQPPLAAVHAYLTGAVEQKEWRELFGRDLSLFRSPRAEVPAPSRPISDGTIGRIKTAVGKSPEKAALLLTYLPAAARTAPAASREIKAFLDGRGERKAGTLSAFVVVRPAAN